MTRFVYNKETAHEDFPEWKFLFENYLVLSGIDKADTTKTPSGAAKALQNLIHAGDRLAFKLLKSLDDPASATYGTLMEAMEAYFAPKHDASLRFKLDTMKQKEDESLYDYVIRLKPMAKLVGIDTANLNKELLSRIAYNTPSSTIREKAMEKDMTVDKLIKWESTRVAQQQCTSDNTSSGHSDSINFVKNKRKFGESPAPSQKKKCGRCGYDYPHTGKCPADGKTCTVCKKANHFASVCRQATTTSK